MKAPRAGLQAAPTSQAPISWAATTAGVVGLAALAGPLAGAVGIWALPASVALPVFLAIALRPELGAYLYLATALLIVGIPRGSTIPIPLRPNEMLLALILGALAARILADMLAGRSRRLEVDLLDLAFVLLAVTSSVVPLLLRFGRELPISADDLLYAAVLWKLFLVYRLFRYAVTTPRQVAVCLALILLSAAVVAIVAVLQVLGLLGVPAFLWTYYDRPFEGMSGVVTDRATSTLASSFGLADVMAMSLAIALAWFPVQPGRGKLVLAGTACLFVLGCIVSGQFSAVIGLAVVVLTVGAVTGRLRQLLVTLVPTALAAAGAFWPVIEKRLSGFDGLSGLPPSWVGRLQNLRRFVWPELASGANWLVGVRPAARIPAPEAWREWIYIESGYAWVLWTGGLPMAAAFAWFVWEAFRRLARVVAGEATRPVRLAATASIAGLATIVVLMLFDPHLTMRGSADLFFPLLALSFVGIGQQARGRDAPFATEDFRSREGARP